MKTIILAWIATATVAGATIIADGKGFYPILVQVVNADSGTPIKGAMVRIEGAGTYPEQELDPKRQTKVLPESLGKAVTTNAEGISVVFIYRRWSSATIEGKTTYSIPLEGTVVVEHQGKEIYRVMLKAWAEENQFEVDGCSAPWIIVSPTIPK